MERQNGAASDASSASLEATDLRTGQFGGHRNGPVRQSSTSRDGRGALCQVLPFLHCGFRLTSQKNPETESVRDHQ